MCMQGDAQLEKGDYQLAAKSYSKAMELDPNSAVYPASRAKALFQQQLWVSIYYSEFSKLKLQGKFCGN